MINRRPVSGNDYDDDGSDRIAILGVVLVLVAIAGGVVLNMRI
jgi:hypothetical protein